MAGERWETVKAWGLRVAVFTALLPVLYVFSVGPAARWHQYRSSNGTLTAEQHEYMRRFYTPLDVVYINAPAPVAAALDWYYDLWE